MKITIIGYTEGFIISPSVSVYRDGIYEGEVNKNSKLIIDISAPCELEFKCSFRKTKIRIYDEQWILLSFNIKTIVIMRDFLHLFGVIIMA